MASLKPLEHSVALSFRERMHDCLHTTGAFSRPSLTPIKLLLFDRAEARGFVNTDEAAGQLQEAVGKLLPKVVRSYMADVWEAVEYFNHCVVPFEDEFRRPGYAAKLLRIPSTIASVVGRSSGSSAAGEGSSSSQIQAESNRRLE